MAHETPSLKWSHKLSFGLGHVLNDLYLSMWFSYFLVYLQFVQQVPSGAVGLILLIGLVSNALATPLVGYWADHCEPCCWTYGKRKTVHLVGTLVTVVSFPFIFMRCYGCYDSSITAHLVYYIPVVCIFQMGFAAVQVSHLSMIPNLTDVQSERDELTIIRYTLDVATDISIYIVALFAFSTSLPQGDVSVIDDEDDWRFRNIALVITVIGLFWQVIFHFGTPENPERRIFEYGSSESTSGLNPKFISMKWNDWFKEKQFFQVGVLVVLARLFLHLNEAFIPLYLQEGIQAPPIMLAIVPLVFELSGFVSALLIKFAIQASNKKICYIFATCFGFAGTIWLSYDNAVNIRNGSIIAVAILIGISASMMVVLAVSMTSDLIDCNKESAAFVFGSFSFAEKISNGLFVLAVQVGHGYCTDCNSNYYRNVIAHGLSAVAMMSLAIMLTIPHNKLGERSSMKMHDEAQMLISSAQSSYGAAKRGFPLLERANLNTFNLTKK